MIPKLEFRNKLINIPKPLKLSLSYTKTHYKKCYASNKHELTTKQRVTCILIEYNSD